MITLVTAASSNHYKSVKQFLRSVPSSTTTLFYDIGLTKEEASQLQEEFPSVQYRVLDFSRLPDFAQLSAPCAGAYAWKPYIIHEVYTELKEGLLLWCDAGNIILNLDDLKQVIYQSGIYSPQSAFSVSQMTHPDCLERLEVSARFWGKPMRNAAVVGLVCNDDVIKRFVTQWKDYAMIKEISIPETSTRNNHRWDQSILTCLMYTWGVGCTYDMVGVIVHQDCD